MNYENYKNGVEALREVLDRITRGLEISDAGLIAEAEEIFLTWQDRIATKDSIKSLLDAAKLATSIGTTIGAGK